MCYSYHFDTLAHMQLWDRVVERAAGSTAASPRVTRELDIDPTRLRLMAAQGRLERVSRGVYRVSLLPRTQHDDLAEAVAWTLGRGWYRTTIGARSAWNLRRESVANPTACFARQPSAWRRGIQLYRLHRRTLHPSDVTELDDIPVTTVQRTIRDCQSRRHRPYQLRLAVGQAEAGGSLRRSEAEVLRADRSTIVQQARA